MSTRYAGRRFRSRDEALWAVFFVGVGELVEIIGVDACQGRTAGVNVVSDRAAWP